MGRTEISSEIGRIEISPEIGRMCKFILFDVHFQISFSSEN
jgi:hypothetical protein